MHLGRPWRASPLCPHVAVGSGPGWLTEDQLVWGRSPERWTPEGNLLLWAGQGPIEGTAGSRRRDVALKAGGQFRAHLGVPL